MIDSDFAVLFSALTGNHPLRWQGRLFERMRRGDLPLTCSLPTGLGKTSVIPIWLIAFALRADTTGQKLPRRLFYIVNRRTVVDQATDMAERLRRRLVGFDSTLSSHEVEALARLKEILVRCAAANGTDPVAISTLRGDLADNEEWKADPARPAIVIGTIDMIGSKLLFSGYGDGPYRRAHHAGLVGQDSLIVHDEAHLTPAFGQLLRCIADEQRRCHEPRPIHVMELSATTRGTGDDTLELEQEDDQDPLVQQRVDAQKWVKIHLSTNESTLDQIVDLAMAHEPNSSKVLIYLRSPEDVKSIAGKLEKKLGANAGDRIATLTGTMRGWERDLLVRTNGVYRALLDEQFRVHRTVYLVSTSAGEVGIDLDADHMVCDLTTLDSIIQRLGRVNRCGGEWRVATVDIVASGESISSSRKSNADTSSKDPAASGEEHETNPDGSGKEGETSSEAARTSPSRLSKNKIDSRLRATIDLLRKLPKDGGERLEATPRALKNLIFDITEDEKQAAFAETAKIIGVTDILLDSWSLTSIKGKLPGCPEVADYLHGLTRELPETYVVWRKEVDWFADARVDADVVRDWFRACRIKARERLRDHSTRIKKNLKAILANHRKSGTEKDFSVILLDERGEPRWSRLSMIVEKQFRLDYLTVVLPVEVGGLNDQGMLDATSADKIARAVVDDDQRKVITWTEGDDLPSNLVEKERVPLNVPEGDEEVNAKYVLLLVALEESAMENPESTAACQTLHDHSAEIAECATRIAKALALDAGIADALAEAARRHDLGKARKIWQWYARNANLSVPLAKSTKYLHGRVLGGFRHEFGSLLESAADQGMSNHPERDLVLHLIASHHDWARPHFEPRSFDNEKFTTAENETEALEVMRRFGRLQQRFGRWGLAWLESLLRCADITASRLASDMTFQAAEQTTPETAV